MLLMLAAVSCGGEQSTVSEDARAVVKKTLAAARPNERVRVRVRLERTELPKAEDLEVRNQLEEQVTVQRVGTVVDRGEGVGWFDIVIDVESSGDAVPQVRAILESMELAEKSAIEIRQAD